MQPQLESLEFYLKSTRRLIKALANNYRAGLAKELLRNEDEIALIAYKLMRADERWNGKGTRHGFRKQCAIWAILRYLSKKKKLRLKHIPTNSLNYETEAGPIYTIIKDPRAADPIDILIAKEQQQELLDMIGQNSQLERELVEEKYLEGKTYKAISEGRGISRQRVDQLISRALENVKEEYEYKYA